VRDEDEEEPIVDEEEPTVWLHRDSAQYH
jgi:hypothetical protein